MSDLNEQISSWRVSLAQRLGPKPADELEDHLRTIIDSLEPTGLPNEERLLLAAHRLGHPDALSAEFAKVDPFTIWRGRLAWMLVGLVPLQLLLSAIHAVGGVIVPASLNWGWPPWAVASADLAVRALILLAFLGACLWAGTMTRPFRSTPISWLPRSFSRLAVVLVILVVALFLEPFVISRYQGSSADVARNIELFAYIRACSIRWNCLNLAFYIGCAVLSAWLIASQRAETDAAST
jgi:hypothetical protein